MSTPSSDPTCAVRRRPVRAQDLAFLRELFAPTRDDLLLTPDMRDVLVDQRFRAHRRQLFHDHPRARHDVVLLAGERVGRLSYVEDDRAVRVVDLAVSVHRQGRGIGSAVLAGIVEQARAGGRDVRLLSWSGGHGVRRFYLNRGFALPASGDGRDELVRVLPPT